MKFLVGIAAAVTCASPAAAAWITKDYDEFGEYLAAAGANEGQVEFQIVCSIDYYDNLAITLFTGEPYDPGTSYSDEVPLSVMTDGRQQPVAYGSFEDYDGELVVVSDTTRDETLAHVLGAMATSKSTINVQFYQREYRFSPEGLATALLYLSEKCT
jgi:hypothetical protein